MKWKIDHGDLGKRNFGYGGCEKGRENEREELETIILATCPRSFTTKQSREMEQMLERGMADWGCGGGA